MKGLPDLTLALGLHCRCLLFTTWKLRTSHKKHLEFSQPHVLPGCNVKKTSSGLGYVRLRLPFFKRAALPTCRPWPTIALGQHGWCLRSTISRLTPSPKNITAFSQPQVQPGCDVERTATGLGGIRLGLPFCTLQKSCSAHLQALTNYSIGTTLSMPSEHKIKIDPISQKTHSI